MAQSRPQHDPGATAGRAYPAGDPARADGPTARPDDVAADLGSPSPDRIAGVGERAWLRVRCDPITAGLLAAVSLALLAGLIGTGLSLRLARRREAEAISAWRRAEAEADVGNQRLYDISMNLVQRAWKDRRPDRMHALLDEQRPRHPGRVDRRGFEWFYWRRIDAGMTVLDWDMPLVTGLATRSGPLRVAAAGYGFEGDRTDGEARLWDLATGRVVSTLQKPSFQPLDLGFDPRGRCLVLAIEEADHDPEAETLEIDCRIREVGRGALILDLRDLTREGGASAPPKSFAFRPDLERLALAYGGDGPRGPGRVSVIDLAVGREVWTRSGVGRSPSALAFSPDGGRLAWLVDETTLTIHDARDGQRVAQVEVEGEDRDLKPMPPAEPGGSPPGHDWFGMVLGMSPSEPPLSRPAFSPDGGRLAWLVNEKDLVIHDARDGHRIVRIESPEGVAESTALAFHPDCRRLATAGSDGAVRLWDLGRGTLLLTLRGHAVPGKERMLTSPPAVTDLVFGPDGGWLASSGSDGTIRLWDATTGAALQTLKGHEALVSDLRLAPDGRRLISAGADGTVRVWDPALIREERTARCGDGPLYGVAFRPDGRLLLACGERGGVSLLDVGTGRDAGRLPGPAWGDRPLFVSSNPKVALDPRGRELAAIRDERDCAVRDLATGRVRLALPMSGGYANQVAYSPDGSRIATCTSSLTEADDSSAVLEVWDARTGRRLLAHTGAGDLMKSSSLTFSPDGSIVGWTLSSLVEPGQVIECISASSGQVLRAIRVEQWIDCLAFSADGRRCAAGDSDQEVRLWDVASGRLESVLRGHNGRVRGVAFSPDGRRLASAGGEGAVKVWDLRTALEVLSLTLDDGPPRRLAFSRDGHQLVACTDRDTVHVWEADPTPGE